MRIVHLILLFACLFGALPTFGQSTARQRALAAFDDGIQQMVDGSAKRATKLFHQAVAHDSTFVPGLRMLGVMCDLRDDYDCALANYLSVVDKYPDFSRLLYYHIGDVYLRTGQSRKALEYFGKFRELQSRDIGDYGLVGEQEWATEQEVLAGELQRRILSAQVTADSLNYTNASGLYNLGSPINSAGNDYFPFFSNDLDDLLYTRQDRDGDEDLIQGRRRDSLSSYRTSRFGSFNTRQPEGMCTLERDGETIFFTLCHETDSGGGCDLYSGILLKGKIIEVSRLPDYINSNTWDSQAAISCDGRQLFFASTRPGGIGGSDLYSCRRLPDGSWSEPKNLGDGVNTPLDEEAPFLSNDGETLYFSSMGHRGLGDQDIYFSRYDHREGRWTQALNIGPPINSPNRELGFHLSADGQRGFFASDRPGGEGGLDIYGFTLAERLTGKEVTFVSGFVSDSLTGEPIIDQEVQVTGGDIFRTNYAGRFFICAPPNKTLPLSVDHRKYLPYRRDFAVPTWANRSPYRIDLLLAEGIASRGPAPQERVQETPPVTTDTTRVLFAFEAAELARPLQKALRQFIEDRGVDRIMGVTVSGFTDEVGSSAYNQRLSERRAASVVRLLTEMGISEEIIEWRGRGELSGRRERDQNRRVEITLRLR